MKRRSWIFWLAVFTAGLFTLAALSLFALARSLGGAAPSVRPGSTVIIDLSAQYPEEHLYDLGGLFLRAEALTFRDLLIGIARARDDERVEGLRLRIRGSSLGWAHVAELRARLADFKSSGKPLAAYIESASSRDYAIATVADEIVMHPRGFLDLRGVRAELTFLRSLLDWVGVEAEFERIGEYKDAPDVFLRNEMSPETRESIGALVRTIEDALLGAVTEGRGMARQQAEALVAQGPFTAEQALESGLVDEIRYLDELDGPDGEEPEDGEEEGAEIALGDYRLASRSGPGFRAEGRIALIYGIGAIVSGRNADDALFGRVMGSDTIAEAFRAAREDESIAAVVFRIDSPGGSDLASDIIWREAELTREVKPVVVSMGDLAASGGYWIATASDAIVAEPTTITGSIGIYAGKFNLRELYRKLGVSKDGVSTAANADFFSDSRSFTEEERSKLHAILESGYDAFLERVAASRDMTVDEVDQVARGRVWSGRDALERGLVDELGGFYRALDLAKERAGIDPDARVELRILPEKPSLFEALLRSFAQGVSAPRRTRLPLDLEGSPFLQLLASGQPLAMAPYSLELK